MPMSWTRSCLETGSLEDEDEDGLALEVHSSFHSQTSDCLQLPVQHPQQSKRPDDSRLRSSHGNQPPEHLFVTRIRATDIVVGLRRVPAGFYVAISTDGVTKRTTNKPVFLGSDELDWDEQLPLSWQRDRSVISFEVYASFELGPMLGIGELVLQVEITVEELLNYYQEDQFVTLQGPNDSEVSASCATLSVMISRRVCDISELTARLDLPWTTQPDVECQLVQFTNTGHHALLRYRRLQDQQDLSQAIEYFERARDICPADHPNRGTVLFNLATAKFIQCQVNSTSQDLDMPIAWYRDALQLRPASHPDHPATLLDLSIALLARFQSRGSKEDKTEARYLLLQVLELSKAESYTYRAARFTLQVAEATRSIQAVQPDITPKAGDVVDQEELIRRSRAVVLQMPDRDPRKPPLLADLGTSLYHRFERIGGVADIHESVSMLEEAVQLTHQDHPSKLGFLNNLGIALSYRFESLDDFVDLGRAISMFEEVARLTPDDHPDKPLRLNNLGNSLCQRFECLGNLVDVDKSISILEEAVGLTAEGHPGKPSCLDNLGDSLWSRFERVGDLVDLNKIILTRGEVVQLTPKDDFRKPDRMNKLGFSLSHRFERLGDLVDIDRAVLIFEELVRLTPDNHPSKPGFLDNLGTSLSSRFGCSGVLVDVGKSISILEQAVGLTPNDHPGKPECLSHLGIALHHRFDHLGNPIDLDKSILNLEEAVGLARGDHPDLAFCLNILGILLSRRFDRIGNPTDIAKSILMLQKALQLISDNHRDNLKPACLNALGTSLSRRFEQFGGPVDLDESISLFEQALRLIPDGDPDRPVCLTNLGNSLSHRFQCLGDLIDMDKSILIREQAVRLTPDRCPEKPAWLNNLSDSLYLRFKRIGDPADITNSILMSEKALQLTPAGHPDRPTWLSNLGSLLSARFDCLGEPGDLDKSISVEEEALRLTSDGDLDKPTRLGNLAKSLSSRFQHLGDPGDLENSISMAEKAVQLIPDGHPWKRARLHNLGILLLRRFQSTGDLADLEKSMSMKEEVVRLTPDSHPSQPLALKSLATSLMSCFQQSRDPSCLTRALSHSSNAARASAGPPSVRFQAVRLWISCARQAGDSQSLLDAYTTSLNLLPELAWIGLPLKERHRLLLEAVNIAQDAAAEAVEAHCLNTAVEWLEQGRSIVWTELLQLRTSADDLRVEHPTLAARFEQISRDLELAGSCENPPSNILSNSQDTDSLLGKEAQRHRELARTREGLLTEIRSLPGFERFLLPKTIRELAASAHSGPIVFLNASEKRCDALVVKAVLGDVTVIHVPLSGVSYAEVESLREKLHLLLNRNGRVLRNDMSTSLVNEESVVTQSKLEVLHVETDVPCNERGAKLKTQAPDDMFKSILACLWKHVVDPVLEALGLSTPPQDGEEMSRVFWCPTGPFVFLPIHAAGLYDVTESGSKLSDFVISSYTPTMTALELPVQKDSPTKTHLVAVPQPESDGQSRLWLVDTEIEHIRTLTARSQFVTLRCSCGTVEEVVNEMKASDWIHFACHGVQDPFDPLESGLCLANGRRLKLSDIIRCSRRRGGLAFLSACQTAKGDEKLSEEAIHLAAGMLLAGYSGVIATMWSIMDNDAPRVTKDVYEYLLRDGKMPASTEAAHALHYAVQRLRDSGAPFLSWVPYIHVGV